MAAAALLLAGCAKEMDSPVKETPLGMKTVTLKASYDADLTKTTYEGDKTLSWTAGDKIGVGVTVDGQIQTVAFELTDGAGTPSGTFTGEIPENGEVMGTAFYPWNGEQSNDAATGGSNVGGDGDIYFHLFPETAWTEDSAPLLLAAQFEDPNAIVFKQAAGAMKVTLKEVPADADKLVLTVGGKEISGWFALDPANAGTDAITTANSGTGTSQLAYTFATADADRDMTFYFPLPAIELPSFNIELFAGNASLWSMASTKSRTITRGKILRMPELTVEVASRTYYLVGFIGDVDYYGDDYKFDNDGVLETTLPATSDGKSYVYIKRGDGRNYYFPDYCEATSGTVYYEYIGSKNEKMLVPDGKKLAFTLVDNGDNNSLDLSYEVQTTLERVWGMYSTSSAYWNESFGGTPSSDRNIAMDGEYIYLPETTAAAKMWMIPVDGQSSPSLVNVTGVSGGTHALSCVRMIPNTSSSVNGGNPFLMGVSLTVDDNTPMKVYSWANGPTEAPTATSASTWCGRRLGDKFTVYGSLQDGGLFFKDWNNTYDQGAFMVLRTAWSVEPSDGYFNPRRTNMVAETGIGAYYPYPDDVLNGLYATVSGSASFVSFASSPLTTSPNETGTFTTASGYYSSTAGYNFITFKNKRYIAYVKNAGAGDGRFYVLEGEVTDSWSDLLGSKRNVIYQADIQQDLDYHDGAYHQELEGGVTKTSNNSALDCATYVTDSAIYFAAMKQGVGLSLFKLSK